MRFEGVGLGYKGRFICEVVGDGKSSSRCMISGFSAARGGVKLFLSDLCM